MSKPAKKEEGAVDLAASSPAAAQEVAELHEVIEGANKPQPDYQGIAILGSHPETVGDAPFNDKSWKIYACSPHNIEMRTLPRIDEWFEIHKPVTDKTRRYEYLRRLEENRVAQDPAHCDVIWMRDEEALPRFKDARPYPEKQLKDEFGPSLGRLLTGAGALFASAPGGADAKNEESLYARLMAGRMADGRIIGDDPHMNRFLIGLAREVRPEQTVTETGDQGGRSLAEELKDIQKLRRTDRRAYDNDAAIQAREREIIEALDKQKARA